MCYILIQRMHMSVPPVTRSGRALSTLHARSEHKLKRQKWPASVLMPGRDRLGTPPSPPSLLLFRPKHGRAAGPGLVLLFLVGEGVPNRREEAHLDPTLAMENDEGPRRRCVG